jgi:hypothetical protein
VSNSLDATIDPGNPPLFHPERFPVPVDFLAKSVATMAGAAVIGAVAAGVVTAGVSPVTPAVAPVVFGVPMPLQPAPPAPGAPTPDQLYNVLNGLAQPGVPGSAKGYLVEGGVGILAGRAMDSAMRKATAAGKLPVTFAVSDIVAAGPGLVTANVTATTALGVPTTTNLTFVDQGGWKLARSSASQVLSLVN